MRNITPCWVPGLLLLAFAACRTKSGPARLEPRQEAQGSGAAGQGHPGEPKGCVLFVCYTFPQVDTSIVAVDLEQATIVLAGGRAAGVEPGFVFDVHRGRTYKGQVRVQRVEEDWSEATILHSKKPIEPGDAATTRL